MTIKAKRMRELSDYWIELVKLRDKVLEHAKTFTKDGHYRSTSYLPVEEYSFLYGVILDDFKELFEELGYEVGIEKYDTVQDGYFGEVRLYW